MERKVMIVDDEPDIREVVKVVLEPFGFEVVAAENGDTCIEELQRGFRGVILMDIMMPGMNGWETIRKIESNGLTDGNIISMLTAKEDPDTDLSQMTETVLNYIRKPFKAEYLVSTVEKYCAWLDQNQKAPAVGN